MHEYEIRILTEGSGDTIIEIVHLNDVAAVRSAKRMASGKRFEVWRGLDCLYPDAGAYGRGIGQPRLATAELESGTGNFRFHPEVPNAE